MAEDVKLNISGNMSKLKGQLSKADSDVSKTKGKLNQLKTQIKQTESKMAQLKQQMMAQGGGMLKSVGGGALGAGLSLAAQEYFTSSGMEGSFLATLGAAVLISAPTGPTGMALAAIMVSIAEVTKALSAVAAKSKSIDDRIREVDANYLAMDREARAHRRQLDDQLGKQWLAMEKLSKKSGKIMSENIAKQIILQEM